MLLGPDDGAILKGKIRYPPINIIITLRTDYDCDAKGMIESKGHLF